MHDAERREPAAPDQRGTDGVERFPRLDDDRDVDVAGKSRNCFYALVKGSFRSLSDVPLPESREQRINLRDSLASGESYFRQATERYRSDAPKACFALAVLTFVRYSLEKPLTAKREQLRSEALDRARDAVTAIHQAESARAYEDMGVLGQARFLQAILQMSRLDPVDARAAMDAWQGMTTAAGRFPKAELSEFVEDAEAVDTEMAVEIAESIWEHRPDDAAEILAGVA